MISSSVNGFSSEIAEPCFSSTRDGCWIPQRRVLPALDLLKHILDAVLEIDLRRPAQLSLDFIDIRESAVRLARPFRHVDDFATQNGHQTIDRLRLAGANIKSFADDLGLCRLEERCGHIRYIDVVAGLRAVADHRERTSGELLA